jgi:GNAT superfamily N-acetyltransferase
MPESIIEVAHGDYLISTDPSRLDLDAVHAYLTRVYWSEGISRELVERAARGAICFGVYHSTGQVGFARVITDAATFAYLSDVYVLDEHRGRGLAKAIMRAVMAHPALQSLRRFVLVTKDAHRLYEPFGFVPVANPESYMEILREGLYRSSPQTEAK